MVAMMEVVSMDCAERAASAHTDKGLSHLRRSAQSHLGLKMPDREKCVSLQRLAIGIFSTAQLGKVRTVPARGYVRGIAAAGFPGSNA